MSFLKNLFGSKSTEDEAVYKPPTLDQYVSQTATMIAERSTPGGFGGLSKPEIVVNEIRMAATSLARSSGMADEGGRSAPLTIEEAMVKTCDDFRARFHVFREPQVHYRDGDAESAGMSVADLPGPPRRSTLERVLGI